MTYRVEMNESPNFRILLVLLLASLVAHRACHTRRFPPADDETTDGLETYSLSVLAALLSVLALLSSFVYVAVPSLLSWASMGLPSWLRRLGLALSASGFLLLEGSHRALGRNRSDQPRITRTQQLVQTGPYRRIRHPINAGFLLILGSTLSLSSNRLPGGARTCSVALDSAVRMRYEESAMLNRFGAANPGIHGPDRSNPPETPRADLRRMKALCPGRGAR